MPQSDWTPATTNTAAVTIYNESGDHVMQIDMYDVEHAHYLLNQSRINAEIKAKVKWVAPSGDMKKDFIFRAQDVDMQDLYVLRLDATWPAVGELRPKLYRVSGGSWQLVSTATMYAFLQNTWYEYRLRLWDPAFPPGKVRATIELWTGGAWVEKASFTDDTPHLHNTSGKTGFGAYGVAGLTHRYSRFNDIIIAEQVA